MNNVSTGSMSNVAGGSMSNVQGAHIGAQQQQQSKSTPKFEGNIVGNIGNNLLDITSGISTLVGAVFGYDKEARKALGDLFKSVATEPDGVKKLGNMLLSTYNLTLDDFGTMPLGEMVGNVLAGAWKHPLDAYFDIVTVGQLSGANKAIKVIRGSKLSKVSDMDIRTRLAEQVTKENLELHRVGTEFTNQIKKIEQTYNPELVAKGMQAIETVGFKNAPRQLIPVMQDLTKANDTYKQFTSMAGAEMLDDVDMATRELIARQHGITFEDARKISKDTRLYQDVANYVAENDVKPLFHLSPEIYDDLTTMDSKTSSNLLKRVYGTMKYDTAAVDLGKKADDFVNKVLGSQTFDSVERLNKKILGYNKENGTNVKTLEGGKSLLNNRFLTELNSELKKTMLGGGVYLGANILTTTLSILNNFDLNAVRKTLQNLPKFKMATLQEAQSPGLRLLSRLNNRFYRPIASVDRYLEDIATTYINYLGSDQAKFLQSAIPSRTVITNPALRTVAQLVPFGSYPAAAVQEIAAHLKYKPGKALTYNQINKIGQQENVEVQGRLGVPINPHKALRKDEQGNVIQRQTIITPIQALNMFLLGTQGDAIQIPIFNFINGLISGKGDPNVFEVEGKKYRVENGVIKTSNGEFNLLPSLSYVGRSLLTPVQFYNQVIVPLMTDKYVKDETQLFNKLITNSQYASMDAATQRKVTDRATEKLGKRLLGTYEYKYYNPDSFISRRVQRKVYQKRYTQKRLRNN